MRRLTAILCLLAASLAATAQSPYAMTTMARDFWVMFLPNTGGYHQLPLDSCTLIATGPEAATVTVVSDGDSVSFPLAAGGEAVHLCGTNAEVRAKAYHVTATADIALYARNAIEGSHDVAMIIPTLCLGTKYIVQSVAAASDDTEMLGIVATEDSTVVTVHLVNPNGIPIPPDDIEVPGDGLLHIPLQRGEAYIVSTQQHRTYGAFTGMDVTSNGRPFALFLGNSAAHVPAGDLYNGGHLYEQAVPYSQWGHLHRVGCVGEQQRIYYLMTSADDGNMIFFNSETPNGPVGPTLDRGHSQTIQIAPHPYTAAPIATSGRMGVMLLLSSYGTSGFCGGPSSVMIPSLEHGVQRAWFTAEEFDPYQENHLVYFCDTALVHGLRLDGVPVNDSSTWNYLNVQAFRTTVGLGPHRLEIDSGTFVAFLYGLRNSYSDSYANPVGMALDPYPRDTLYRTDTVCGLEPYSWGPFRWDDGALTDTGTLHLARNVYAPDTVHRYYLTLTVLPAYRSTQQYELVPGESVVVEDTVLSTPGTYIFHHTTLLGCDSTLTVVIDHCTAPAPCVETSLPFIDFDHPVVTFTDCTEGEHTAVWRFGDGITLTGASVRRQLHHPLPDSLTVELTVCDPVGCCADTVLSLPAKTRSVWFPNVFTPEGDSDNRFGAVTSLQVASYELTTYDRHGVIVFHTTDILDQWDGTCNGTPMPQGTYAYRWTITDSHGFRQDGSGTVTLLR
ncbi:MAG: gliding motility-associated C-terminal domain-containing protein [Bacteroidales bacterium]|nr:gliding motility-associated C-terminal domain-containing protein [Bacteroidales bacterium]